MRPEVTEPSTNNAIRDIVILGGGTAGWMAASYLAKALHGTVRITVMEAATIPKIGVGEATVPNLQRAFFDFLEIPEDEWMRQCNASFKIAVKFVNWRGGAAAGRDDHFYHPFGLLPNCDGLPLSHHWVRRRQSGNDEPFDYACFKEPPIMDAKRSPRHLDGRRATNYAWHFDAHLVADFLRDFAVRRHGVTHIIDELDHVILDDRGYIRA